MSLMLVNQRLKTMKARNEQGFSLIELVIVVVIIGIIAALAVPALQKGYQAAENGSTFGTLRSIHGTQVGFYSQNSRWGSLVELNRIMSNGIGTTIGDRVVRGRFTFEMSPLAPTPTELQQEFTITATSSAFSGEIYKYELTQTGEIVQILP